METAIGEVRAVHDGYAQVTVTSPLTCARCVSGRGCGAGLMLAGDRRRQIELAIPPGLSLRPGDAVRLTMAPAQLLRAALLAYGLPLGTMLLFLALAWGATGGLPDAMAVPAALVGLVAGLLAGRRILAGDAACRRMVPVIDTHQGATPD